jgi:hypothetical protein
MGKSQPNTLKERREEDEPNVFMLKEKLLLEAIK